MSNNYAFRLPPCLPLPWLLLFTLQTTKRGAKDCMYLVRMEVLIAWSFWYVHKYMAIPAPCLIHSCMVHGHNDKDDLECPSYVSRKEQTLQLHPTAAITQSKCLWCILNHQAPGMQGHPFSGCKSPCDPYSRPPSPGNSRSPPQQ